MIGNGQHVLTLPGDTSREVFLEPNSGVFVVNSSFGSDEYKRKYNVIVDEYSRSGLLARLRDRFHSSQARLYRPERGLWQDIMARLTTPVPGVIRYGKFLDVGCNTASLVSKLPEPWERYGIEINAEAAGKARAHGNVTVFEGPLERLETELRFDYVRASHTIEHVEDYEAFLGRLFSIVAEDGYALIYTPNTASFSFWLFRRYWGAFYEQTHVRLFNLRNLSSACEGAGFEVLERGTYFMGVTADSLLRALRVNPEGRFFRPAFFLLLIALYPASFIANFFHLGGTLYMYLRKPPRDLATINEG